MNTVKLRKLIETIRVLKEKLKCPICLDVMQQVVELCCGHRYCKECYFQHKSVQKKSSCPLCKKEFKRRSIVYTDNYASTVGKFVNICCDNIKNVYNCEVEQLEKQLSEGKEVLHDKTSILQQSDTNKISCVDVPSTSKGINRGTRSRYSKRKFETRQVNESTKENCESAFDKLMNAQPVATFNKKNAKRIYSNKKKSKANPKPEYDLLQFDNDENKTAVLQWLHDTRNKFDRLSQTQSAICEDTVEVPTFDLVSISQFNGKKTKIRPITYRTHKGRAKSLDIEIRKPPPTQQKSELRATSLTLENYNIEEIDTEEEIVKKVEEKVILDLIENEFLDTLEKEVQNMRNSENSKSKRCTRSKKAKPPSPSTTTGWERLTKMEKTIRRNEKVPKQLYITLRSTPELKNEKKPSNKETDINASVTDKRSVGNENVVTDSINRPPEDESCLNHIPELKDDDPSKTNEQPKLSYDLNKLEDYIAKNIETIEKDTSHDSITNQTNQQHNLLDPNAQNCETEQVERTIASEDKEPTKQSETVNSVEEKPCTPQNDVQEANPDIKDSSCALLDVLYNMPTQRDPLHGGSAIKEENFVTVTVDDINDAESPVRPLEDDASADDEIMRMYDCPTQKITHTCAEPDVRDGEEGGNGSVEDLFFLLETCLEECIAKVQSADKAVENHLHDLKSHLSTLKSMHNSDEKAVKEKCVDREFCDGETQTFVNVQDEIIQTENEKSSISVQTEDVRCIKCGIDLNENVAGNATEISQNTKIAIETMMNETDVDFKPILHSTATIKNALPHQAKPSNLDVFTCSLDHLNFETQELAKNQGLTSKVLPRKNETTQEKEKTLVKQEVRDEAAEPTPGSVLVCSLNSVKPSTSNKVNRKLNYEADRSVRFKRIRAPSSDSESDEDNPGKRKCNRFVRDDLTVEFLTNSEVGGLKKHNKSSALDSQDSEGINYDEYLAEVMKKYDDNLSPTNTEKIPKPKETTAKKNEETTASASKNKTQPKVCPEISTSSRDSFKSACENISNLDGALPTDDIFMNEDNLLKLENDIREYERTTNKAQHSEISDIIAETEEMESCPKKRKIVLSKSKAKEGELGEPGIEILGETSNAPVQLNSEQKIKILGNVKIKSQDRKEDEQGVEEEEDLFSDEDIVDTTPRKKEDSFAERLAHSQIMNSISLIGNADNYDFDDMLLPPPHEFQDDVIPASPEAAENVDENRKRDSNAVMNLTISSLTPDNLSQFVIPDKRIVNSPKMSPHINEFSRRNESKKNNSAVQHNLGIDSLEQGLAGELSDKDKITPKKEQRVHSNMCHSTPVMDADLMRDTLGFSPIAAGKSQKMGLSEMAQATRYTPLTATSKHTPQKQNLLTSTPGQRSIWNYVRSSQKSEDVPPKAKPCIAGTRLTKEQVQLVSQLTHKKLATYSSQFDSSVTHLIVNVNEKGCVKDYTIKFVSAVAAGIWVLRFEWIEECLSGNRVVPEERFEALDISGASGPRTSRLTRKKNPLFRGYKFFCAEPFISTTREEVEKILKMLDGKILSDLRGLLEDDGNIGIIIAEGHATQDFEQYERWVEEYRTVTVDIEWMSKCVGQYKVLSIRPFVWCSEDNLGDLGYPSMLTETVPLSFTETF